MYALSIVIALGTIASTLAGPRPHYDGAGWGRYADDIGYAVDASWGDAGLGLGAGALGAQYGYPVTGTGVVEIETIYTTNDWNGLAPAHLGAAAVAAPAAAVAPACGDGAWSHGHLGHGPWGHGCWGHGLAGHGAAIL